jgi:hypothetical protein
VNLSPLLVENPPIATYRAVQISGAGSAVAEFVPASAASQILLLVEIDAEQSEAIPSGARNCP